MSTTEERLAAQKRNEIEAIALDTVDDRFGSSSWLKSAMDKIFPDHWSFMVGEIAMYCLIILIITGVYLALFYHASNAFVVYHGSYKPLDGVRMTEAYQSAINISFDVPGRSGHAPDPPLGRGDLPGRGVLSTCAGSSSPAPSASRERSTGSSG